MPKPESKQVYGWIRQQPDFRDVNYVPTTEVVAMPASVDLTPVFPVYDQGQVGSCTGNMASAAARVDRLKQGLPDMTPSRLFLYYYARQLGGTDTATDSGATIRDVVRALDKYGAPSEVTWPYDIDQMGLVPSRAAQTEGVQHVAMSYQSVSQDPDLYGIRRTLADGLPVCAGVSVYSSFELDSVALTGVIPYPQPTEDSLGGHAILLVAYDDAKQLVKFRNSWGATWGDKGYGYFPYRYLANPDLAADFWCVQTVK